MKKIIKAVLTAAALLLTALTLSSCPGQGERDKSVWASIDGGVLPISDWGDPADKQRQEKAVEIEEDEDDIEYTIIEEEMPVDEQSAS